MRKRVHKSANLSGEANSLTNLAHDSPEQQSVGHSSLNLITPLYQQQLLSHTPDAVMVLDKHFHLQDLNLAAARTFHLSTTEVRNRPCQEVLRCQNLNRIQLCGTSSCPLTRVLQHGRALPHEELIVGQETQPGCEVSASVTPIEVEDQTLVAFIARDMSALKVANRVRSNFVSMVSHELRTPLNSVHGFIDLLLQGHMGPLNDEQSTYLGYTQEGVQQLISIVEDILFMTRSDLGQFETKQQEIQLPPLVQQVVSTLHPQALKAGVTITQQLPRSLPPLYADPKRIRQVLNNLLANAIKFTPPDGSVIIHAERGENSMVNITVSDTGYGIPLEDRDHIFERFYQSNHSEQSKMGGYGLGLSIARLIVEQHGGSIHCDSQMNKGTTFLFTVPIYYPKEVLPSQ